MNLRFTLAPLLFTLGPAAAQTTFINEGASLTVTSGTTLYVIGTVQNMAGSTLTNAGTVQLTGDLTNTGTLTSTGTLLFSGGADQTFTPGPASVAGLTLSNTGVAGANRLFLAGDLSVSALLTLSQGIVRTQGLGTGTPLYTLSLPDGGRVVGEAPGQYVQGRLMVTRASVSASTGSVDFSNSLVLNPNGQNLGVVTVTRTAGLQTAGVSYGTNMGGSNKGIDRVWQVTTGQALNASTPVSATVSWVSNDDNGFNPATAAQLWRAEQASGPWTMQGAAASASARSFTANTTQLGTLTVSNTTQPLPITLVKFEALAQGPDGLLLWTTASELRNDYFVVESSADGVVFQTLGQVAGHGTTTQAQQYQFLDPSLARYASSTVYYRLRQVDLDGTATYSPVKAVTVTSGTAMLALFPNPTSRTATLRGVQPGTPVTVVDAISRVVLATTADATGTASLVLPLGCAKGVYMVRAASKALRLVVE
jgi:hypothetical protein